MSYLTREGIQKFHDDFLALMEQKCETVSADTWGYPGGYYDSDTYSFKTKCGTLLIGHVDHTEQLKRWWIPVAIEEEQINNLLYIAFELSIPNDPTNNHLSIHFRTDNDGNILVLHKGKFTVGFGSLSMSDFFEYYQAHKGEWPVVNVDGQKYLKLGQFNQNHFEDDFKDFLESLACFAKYVPKFKNNFRH